jgi:hypothetical protein
MRRHRIHDEIVCVCIFVCLGSYRFRKRRLTCDVDAHVKTVQHCAADDSTANDISSMADHVEALAVTHKR